MHLKRRNSWPPDVSALDALNDIHVAETSLKKCTNTNTKYYKILTIHECVEK